MVSDLPPLPPDARLGAILVRTAGLPLRTLQEALDRQKQNGQQLGEILCAMGVITSEQLGHALALQSQLRRPADE